MNLDTKIKMRLKLIIHWSKDESMNDVKLYLHKNIYNETENVISCKKWEIKRIEAEKIAKHVKLRVWELVANGELIIFTLFILPAARKFLTTANSQPDDEISHRKLQNYRIQAVYLCWVDGK